MAPVCESGSHAKLVSRWIGPWRVVLDHPEHAYAICNVQHLVTGETLDANVVRMYNGFTRMRIWK